MTILIFLKLLGIVRIKDANKNFYGEDIATFSTLSNENRNSLKAILPAQTSTT